MQVSRPTLKASNEIHHHDIGGERSHILLGFGLCSDFLLVGLFSGLVTLPWHQEAMPRQAWSVLQTTQEDCRPAGWFGQRLTENFWHSQPLPLACICYQQLAAR